VVNLVNKFGVKSWSFIARQLKGRLGKQCRERYCTSTVGGNPPRTLLRTLLHRWYNHLNPAINKEPWTNEEDNIITTVGARLEIEQPTNLLCNVLAGIVGTFR
jgi:hypothetical protein